MQAEEHLSWTQEGFTPTGRKPPRGKFIKGPVPLEWLRRASECGGQALAVGLLVWFEHGIRSGLVTLSHTLLAKLGVRPETGRRALCRLEAAGLVKVVRQPGNAPRVVIVETETENRS